MSGDFKKVGWGNHVISPFSSRIIEQSQVLNERKHDNEHGIHREILFSVTQFVYSQPVGLLFDFLQRSMRPWNEVCADLTNTRSPFHCSAGYTRSRKYLLTWNLVGNDLSYSVN